MYNILEIFSYTCREMSKLTFNYILCFQA